MKITIFVLFAFIALILCADDFSGDKTVRNVECSSSGTEINIKSSGKFKSANLDLQNELQIKVVANDNKLMGKMEYQSESSTDTTSLKLKQKLKYVYYEVFSYVPTTDRGYNGEARTANFVIGGNCTLQPFDTNANKCTKDSNNIYSAKTVCGMTGSNGQLTITLQYSGADFTAQQVPVPNNAIKISVLIENFPFPQGTDTQYIGLRMVTISSSRVNQKTTVNVVGNAQQGFTTDNTINKAWVSWKKTASAVINGAPATDVDVLSTDVSSLNLNSVLVESGESCNQIYYTFKANRPTSVNWDPTIGISTTSGSSSVVFSFFILALIFLLF